MHREEVELMRNAHGVVRTAPITNTEVRQAVSSSERRVALVFTGPAAGSITISTEPAFSAGQGLMLTPGMSLQITLDRHGDAVKKPWYALTSAGDMTLGYLEVTLDA
jgi:hypothetical protein